MITNASNYHPDAKLDEDLAREIYDRRPHWWVPGGENRRLMRDATEGARYVARDYPVSHTIVLRIWNEEAWTEATLGVGQP